MNLDLQQRQARSFERAFFVPEKNIIVGWKSRRRLPTSVSVDKLLDGAALTQPTGHPACNTIPQRNVI